MCVRVAADGSGLPHIGPVSSCAGRAGPRPKHLVAVLPLPPCLPLLLCLPSSSPPSPHSLSFALPLPRPRLLSARFSLALMRRYRLSSGGGWASHCGFLQKLLFHPGIKFPAYLNTTLCLLPPLLPPALSGAAVRTLVVFQLCARITARPVCPHPVCVNNVTRQMRVIVCGSCKPTRAGIHFTPCRQCGGCVARTHTHKKKILTYSFLSAVS